MTDVPTFIRLPPGLRLLRASGLVEPAPVREEPPSCEEDILKRWKGTGESGSGAFEVEPRRAERVRVLFPRRERPRRVYVDIHADADNDTQVRERAQRPEGGDDRIL